MKNVQATPEHMRVRTTWFRRCGRERFARFEPEVVPESEKTGRRFDTGVDD